MRQLTIFIDMDGTIENLLDVWLERLNKKYNRAVQVNDVKDWDIGKVYPDLSNEQIMDILDDSIWQEVRPLKDAPEVIENLIQKGHNVYIVTSTPYLSIRAKMEDLLFKWFPFLTWNNVIIMTHKQLLHGDIMIDDALHNLLDGDYCKVVFDAPYNRDIDDNDNGLNRVHNWEEIDEFIKTLEN